MSLEAMMPTSDKKKLFSFTAKQLSSKKQMASGYQYFMLFGGSRSGKTFLAVYAVVIRALKSPGSRHVILRYRFNAVKASVFKDTFKKVMQLCFPDVYYHPHKTDLIVTFKNGSEIWFGGLDDADRAEKILGQEFATIYLNECSQIPWSSVGIAITRLAQNCEQVDGRPLKLRMFFDCNPPDKNHWTYKLFIKHVDPVTKKALPDSHLYGSVQVNPNDNRENLPESYIKTLEALPPHLRKRFLEGEFKDANPNALFREEILDRWRVDDPAEVPDMVRVVVAVDPSGADDEDNETNDAIGIYAAGLGTDGNVYLLEDSTVKAGPATWGKVAVSAYHRHEADAMVGEQNFGGAMVKFVIQAVDRSVNYKIVNASRGKIQRAEPFSPLFEDGRVRMVGRQVELEEELAGFSTHGYTGEDSPNRADAAIWCLAELFPAVVGKKKKKKPEVKPLPTQSRW